MEPLCIQADVPGIGNDADPRGSIVPSMYGPPSDCKERAEGEKTSLRKCIRPLVEHVLLTRMSCARVRPYKPVGCSFETILGRRLKTRRCDCSFVLAVSMQTSVGKFKPSLLVR